MPPSPHVEDDAFASDADADDDNDDALEARRDRKRRKKHRAKEVFDRSGLTTEERRDTRAQLRQLHAELEAATAPEQFKEIRDKNNNLFHKNVRFAREAVLDGENLELAAQKQTQFVETLMHVPRFDCGRLVIKLKSKVTTDGRFNWTMLGKEAGICYNAVPDRVTFLCGPLGCDPTLKKKRERKERRKQEVDTVEAVKPKEVEEGEQEGDPNKLSATEKTIKHMEKSLKRRVKENIQAGLEPEIEGVKYLCNPRSFTQTVENIFHFSFLIKKGEAKIGIRKNSPGLGGHGKRGLYVGVEKPIDGENTVNKQAVLTFTMRDWRALTEGLTEGDLPNRETSSTGGLSQRV